MKPSVHRKGAQDDRSTGIGRHAQRGVRADVGRHAKTLGRQRGLISAAGRSITSRDRRPIPIASTRRRAAAGSARSSSDRTTAAQTWEPVGNKFVYDGVPGTHQWYDGTPHPWEFARVWHLEPSLTDPDTVYAGVQDAALFRSTDGGQTWQELPGLRGHESGAATGSRAPAACACTRSCSIRRNPNRIFIAISAAGAFRTDDGGETWRPINRGLKSQGIPDPDAEVGHCVHRIAMHRSRPDVLFMQKHWDVMRSDDAGDSWREVSGNLPTDFGFPIDVHAHEPETIYVVPIKSDSEHFPPDGKLRVYRSRTGGNEWEALTNGLPQRDCYVNVLRDAMAVDSLDRCGIYFGTTGGQVYASADAGDSWAPIVAGSAGRAVRRGADTAHDSRRASGASADAGARRRRGDARRRRAVDAAHRSSTRSRPPIRCCAGRSAITSRKRRRPFVRFFACEEDLSHEPPDAPLPDAVVRGAEPFLVVGAMAGG